MFFRQLFVKRDKTDSYISPISHRGQAYPVFRQIGESGSRGRAEKKEDI